MEGSALRFHSVMILKVHIWARNAFQALEELNKVCGTLMRFFLCSRRVRQEGEIILDTKKLQEYKRRNSTERNAEDPDEERFEDDFSKCIGHTFLTCPTHLTSQSGFG